jgi:hypothetical protein
VLRVLDATAKWLVQDLPVVQVVWLRFATHVLLMSLLLAPSHGGAWCACTARACSCCVRPCWPA